MLYDKHKMAGIGETVRTRVKGSIDMPEAMKYGQQEFEVKLPPELIAAELEPNHVDLPQRTVPEHIHYALEHPIDSDRGAGERRHPG